MYLGKSGILKFLFIFLLFTGSVSGQTGKTHKYHFKGDLQETIIQPGQRSIIIDYSLSELNLTSLSDENGIFYRISAPGHVLTTDPGNPNCLFSKTYLHF
jgi:hypothetical protein